MAEQGSVRHAPPHQAAPQVDAISPRLVVGTCMAASVAAIGVWYADDQSHLTTWWDVGALLLGIAYGLAGMALHWRVDWADPVLRTIFAATSVYFLGGLHVASQDHTTTGLYSIASNSQFIPLLYVGAFIAIQRGAAQMCWVHYAAMALLYLFEYVPAYLKAPQATLQDLAAHEWFALVLTHPCYILALHYITTLKGRLRQSERDAHADKQRFLAMLSHEIRSPLQAMLGSIDLLALKVHGASEQRAVERLRHAAAHLDTHLRDVNEYTRLEDPAWRVQAQAVDVVALVQDVCETHLARARAKGLSLHADIAIEDEVRLRRISTDPLRVRQILGNLVTNALKYTPTGTVTVSATWLDAPVRVRLAVTDTGIGIPAADLPLVFEPYVRLEDRRTQGTEGSGLGLAIVRRLVDRLGGEVLVESRLNEGSTFTVILPVQG